MSEQKPEVKQLNISTIEGVLAALKSPHRTTQVAVLKAITKSPEKVLEMARKSDMDFFQTLIDLSKATADHQVRNGYVYTLMLLDTNEHLDFIVQEFLQSENSDILLLAAQHIAKLPPQERIDLLTPVVMELKNQMRSRIAANLLAHCTHMETTLRIRVAALTDHTPAPPPVNDETVESWLAELQGPLPYNTRDLLLLEDGHRLSALLSYWDTLPEQVQVWAFTESLTLKAGTSTTIIQHALVQGNHKALLLAIFDSLRHHSSPDIPNDLISAYATHTDDEIRAAAIRTGKIDCHWIDLLTSEPSDQVRIAVIQQIAREQKADIIPPLGELLEDQNWRIRAAATDALVALAPDSIPILKEKLTHPHPHIRTAAFQALTQLGLSEAVLST